MKIILNLRLAFALLVVVASPAAMAGTVFSDSFSSGSTLDHAVATPTATSTSYQTYAGLAGSLTNIAPGNLSMTISNSSELTEFVGLFTNSPFVLSQPGDYIALTVVFVNTNVLCGSDTANSSLDIGLYNSGGILPNQGSIALNAGSSSGGTQTWLGYIHRIIFSGTSEFLTRPSQTANGTTSQNQDLLFNNASSSQAFNSPTATAIGTAAGSATTLTSGSTYTMQYVITLNAVGSLSLSNTLYAGSGTGGTVVFTETNGAATNATFLTSGFDGMAIGWRCASSPAQLSALDITSIQVAGQSTVVTTPPTITSEPTPVTVPSGASCAYSVAANGFNVVYQWHRNGTNLLDGGNISGSQSSLLVISPASAADVPSGAGYYVTVSGTGGYSTNSVTNSLALTTATNLIWQGNGADWDLDDQLGGTINNWYDTNGSPQVFNFGDAVTFNDTGAGGTVTLTGSYLSASSVTVNSAFAYGFSGGGSFAGPGSLIYEGTAPLTLNNANTYSGGTIISNASANLKLQNLSGLGSGQLTLASGQMEVTVAGNSGASINVSNVNVANDFTIQLDGLGTYAGYFNGNFSGTTNKTLTFNLDPGNTTTNERIRITGSGTTYNANMLLNSALITLAPYNSTGTQTYNGVISGAGGLIQRGSTVVLNGQNTYSGGTTPSTGTIGLGSDTVGAITSGPIGTGPLYIAPEIPNITGSGTVYASGGAHTIANAIQYQSGTNNLTLIIGGANNLTFTGPFTLNGNDALGTNNIRLLEVTNTALTTFSGVISDLTNSVSAVIGLTISANGTNVPGPLVFNNTETYTGPTTVSGGTLRVNGSLAAASAVTVATNATLAGTGTINGTVTVNTGGTLAPGAASIGTLTVNNNLTNKGNLFFRVNKSLGQSNDTTVVTGTLINSGTGILTVTNLGPALVAGDRFVLFSKAVSGGASLIVTNASVAFTNNLAVDGSISVLASAPSAPTALRFTSAPVVSGTSLTISATNTGGGTLYLLTSTNLIAPVNTWIPVWTNVLGGSSSFTTNLSNTVNPALNNQFYILSTTNN